MTTAHIIILFATGAFTGFASGLLGIGGALIMSPVQYIVFTGMGVPPELAIKLAFGTSLLVILPTALSGAWRHNKKGAVQWKPAIIMGSCAAIAAFGGASLASHFPEGWLRPAFGVFILLCTVWMITSRLPQLGDTPRESPWLWVVWAIPVGLVSGFFGVGGGLLLVPVLVLALRYQMHHAIATSLAAIIFTSVGGIIGYIVNGLGVSGLPAHSLGYVNLPAWGILAVASISLTQLGAITAHKLPAHKLRYVFIAVMVYMGLKMLGLFEWLGWPL
jgi:uncharacterized membrane protein YfcA